jgi:hypothetical protein
MSGTVQFAQCASILVPNSDGGLLGNSWPNGTKVPISPDAHRNKPAPSSEDMLVCCSEGCLSSLDSLIS